MKCSSFRGRKNARRANALAEKQKQVSNCQENLRKHEAYSLTLPLHSEGRQQQLDICKMLAEKLQRLQKNASNIAGKLMEQGAAEAVRTKKNRQGQTRYKHA